VVQFGADLDERQRQVVRRVEQQLANVVRVSRFAARYPSPLDQFDFDVGESVVGDQLSQCGETDGVADGEQVVGDEAQAGEAGLGRVMSILYGERPHLYMGNRRVAYKHGRSRNGRYLFWGNPSSMPPWLGSSQRLVMALPRVKKCTPSVPWAWLSPKSEAFQPPKL